MYTRGLWLGLGELITEAQQDLGFHLDAIPIAVIHCQVLRVVLCNELPRTGVRPQLELVPRVQPLALPAPNLLP